MDTARNMETLQRETALLALQGHPSIWTSEANLRYPTGILRVFLSSTFTDTKAERNYLIEQVSPALHAYGREKGIVVQLVELRWGIKDMASDDHLTWDICRDELEKCHRDSMGVFFVSLVSEKYGWRSLPRTISDDKWKHIAGQSSEAQMEALMQLYLRDDNAVPIPQWTLRRESSDDIKQIFGQVANSCREHIAKCLPSSNIGHSVTHWETEAARTLSSERKRSIWLKRQFADESTILNDSAYTAFVDFTPSGALDNECRVLLKEKLGSELNEADTVISLTATLVPSKDASERFTVDVAYLQSFGAQFQQCLMKEVDAAAVEYNKWKEDAAGLGISSHLLEEFLHHIVGTKKAEFILWTPSINPNSFEAHEYCGKDKIRTNKRLVLFAPNS
jgi:hypothetical protein